MDSYKIHPILIGVKLNEMSMVTYQYGAGEEFIMPIYTWFIDGSEKRVLVDTGELSPMNTENREQLIGAKIYSFEEGIARWGLTPLDIDIVIHTHLHMDHCQNDYKCSNAKFYVHENELAHLHHPHPLDYRYVEDYLEEVEERGQVIAVKGGEEILPGITLLHTPGHTAGGLSVAIQTSQGKAIITGCCSTYENYFPPKKVTAREMEVIPPGTLVNSYEAYDSLLGLKRMADILIPLHDRRFAGIDTIP
jgi:glyoxylase-like metal-dependent hydrolase (beta-lactamase superfamily II)